MEGWGVSKSISSVWECVMSKSVRGTKPGAGKVPIYSHGYSKVLARAVSSKQKKKKDHANAFGVNK